jgi:hypothetical protein
LSESFLSVNEVVICLLLDFQVAELARYLPGIYKVPATQRASAKQE